MEIINGKAIFFLALDFAFSMHTYGHLLLVEIYCSLWPLLFFSALTLFLFFLNKKKQNKCCLQSHSVFLDIKEHAALYLYTDQMDTFQGSLYPKNKSKKRIISGMCVQQCIFDLLPQYNIY